MNIIYAANDKYAKHLAVSMCSLMDKHRSVKNLCVHVMSTDISEESKSKLREIATAYHRELNFYETSDIEDRLGYEADTGRYDVSIMARFFIGSVLDGNIDRALYLDCDTVVWHDISELYNMDMRGYILGAVMEPTIYSEVRDMIGLTKDEAYYNSGVLLIDLKEWRENCVEERLIQYYETIKSKSLFNDQDAINGCLHDEICTIPLKYNFFTNYRYHTYDNLVKKSQSYGVYTKEEYTDAIHHPYIIHYAGDERPWIHGSLNHYKKAYNIYKKKTPWAKAPSEKGKEVYMFMYHMMNIMTSICPALRDMLSNYYINNLKKKKN